MWTDERSRDAACAAATSSWISCVTRSGDGTGWTKLHGGRQCAAVDQHFPATTGCKVDSEGEGLGVSLTGGRCGADQCGKCHVKWSVCNGRLTTIVA